MAADTRRCGLPGGTLCRTALAAAITLIALSLSACGSDTTDPPPSVTPLAQYVLIGYSAISGGPQPLVRAVVGLSAECPAIAFSDSRPQLAMQPRPNPDTNAFPVQVCEAVVEIPDGVTVTIAGVDMPLPVPASGPMTIGKVVVVADSGCKGDDAQPCASDTWQFAQVAAAAAADTPDLVLHLGDYNYRGTPSRNAAGDWAYDGCVADLGKPLPTQTTKDTWDTWKLDFFEPAQPLLAVAPWVVVRGNHELCSRAGRGWFYFLDAHSPLLDPDVETPSCNAPTVPTEPYGLTMANLQLVILDSANACGGGEGPQIDLAGEESVFAYTRQFDAVNALVAAGSKPTWLLTHRPLWGIARYGTAPAESGNITLQKAVAALAQGRLAAEIPLIVSGHMHEFEALSFAGDRASQIVVGDSGVKLAPDALAPGFTDTTIDGMTASGMINDTDHGYLLIELDDGSHWSGTLFGFGPAGDEKHAVARCGLPVDGSLCTPATQPNR